MNTSKQSEHLERMSPKALEEMYTNIGVSNPKEAIEAIRRYTGSAYVDIGEGKHPDLVKLIDEVIDKQPKWDGEIYRGMKVDDDFIENLKNSVGDSIEFHANSPTSFSSDYNVARGFAYTPGPGHRVIFKMQNKSGSSITHNSTFTEEKEVLHKSSEKYKIKSFTFNSASNHYVVELEDNE